MDLRALHRDAVTADRRLKPQIALHGAFGIPIRHLLEFELLLEEAVIAPDEEWIP